MCKRRFPGGLQSSGSYVPFVIQCQWVRSRLLSSRWYSGTVEVGLPKCCLGRSSCLPVPATAVGDESSSTSHLRPASFRRTHHTPLAVGSGEGTVQDGRAHRTTHWTTPSYLSQLVQPGLRSLRSAQTNRLLVPSVKLSTVGGRAFLVAKPTVWNSLPDNVIFATYLSTFRHRLITFSVPGLVPWQSLFPV